MNKVKIRNRISLLVLLTVLVEVKITVFAEYKSRLTDALDTASKSPFGFLFVLAICTAIIVLIQLISKRFRKK